MNVPYFLILYCNLYSNSACIIVLQISYITQEIKILYDAETVFSRKYHIKQLALWNCFKFCIMLVYVVCNMITGKKRILIN